jgi:hypothetical protein
MLILHVSARVERTSSGGVRVSAICSYMHDLRARVAPVIPGA